MQELLPSKELLNISQLIMKPKLKHEAESILMRAGDRLKLKNARKILVILRPIRPNA